LIADRLGYTQETKQTMDQPTYAVQPAAWGNFDGWGCDYTPTIEDAYKACKIWREMGESGDMMIFRILPGGNPIRWVRVYADESIESVTTQELALLK